MWFIHGSCPKDFRWLGLLVDISTLDSLKHSVLNKVELLKELLLSYWKLLICLPRKQSTSLLEQKAPSCFAECTEHQRKVLVWIVCLTNCQISLICFIISFKVLAWWLNKTAPPPPHHTWNTLATFNPLLSFYYYYSKKMDGSQKNKMFRDSSVLGIGLGWVQGKKVIRLIVIKPQNDWGSIFNKMEISPFNLTQTFFSLFLKDFFFLCISW